MCHWSRPISILLIFALGCSFRVYIPNQIPMTHVIKQLFSFCVSTPIVIPLNVNSPSELSWIIALLLVEKSITFNCVPVYQSLYTTVSWFCSFHSGSVPRGLSHGIPQVHYSLQHNSIPSSTVTTICSVFPQSKGIPSFSNFLPPQRAWLWIFFIQVFLFIISLGYKPSSNIAGF